MDIRYHGKESITIKNKGLEILVGATFPLSKKTSQRLLIANPSCGEIGFGSIDEDKVLVNGPGDYEIGGVDINGFVYGDKSIFYSVVVDGYRVGIVFEDGAIEKVSDKVDNLDVLIVLNPLVGVEKKLVSMAKKSGANFLILVGDKGDYKEVLDAFDREDIEAIGKFSLKEGEELVEGMEVVLLSKI